MSIIELSDICLREFRTQKVLEAHPRLYQDAYSLTLLELSQYKQKVYGEELLKYYYSLLLLKLSQEPCKGPKIQNLIHDSMQLITLANNHKGIIIPIMNSIITNEVLSASNEEDVLIWAFEAYELQKFSENKLSVFKVLYNKLSIFIFQKSSELSRNPNGPGIIKNLGNIKKAIDYGLNLPSIVKICGSIGISFVRERNELGGTVKNFQKNLKEDYKILETLKSLNIDDINLHQTIAETEETIRKNNPNVEIPDDPLIIADEPEVLEMPKGASNQINLKFLRKEEHPIYAMKTEKFQVCIYKGKYNGEDVAIKMYKSSQLNETFEKVKNESLIYEKLGNLANYQNCFLKFFGSYKVNDEVYLVMEYVETNLMDKITQMKNNNIFFSEQNLAIIFYKLLLSFAEMQKLKINHGDIKPQNLLIDKFFNLKIIDFSVSQLKNEEITETHTTMRPLQGTKGYMAPEIEDKMRTGDKSAKIKPYKADVFSLGIVFLQMILIRNLENLNTGEKNEQLLAILNDVQYPWARELLSYMLNKEPNRRKSFKDLIQYFASNTKTA